MTGGKSEDKAAFQSEVLQLFLQSVGVVLTDVQDVVFRIAYFERNFVFYEQTALMSDIQRHYTQQVCFENSSTQDSVLQRWLDFSSGY